MSLRTVIVESLDDIGRDAWNAVVNLCPDSTVFQSYEWIDAWTRTVLTPNAQLCVAASYSAGELVGLAPLWHGVDPYEPSGRSAVRFLGAWHSDYSTFPALAASPEVLHSLLDTVGHALPTRESIELFEVPQTSALALCLAERSANSASGVLVDGTTACPRLKILGNESGLHSVFEKDSLKRHEKKLRRLGQVTVEHLTDPAAAAPLLEGFFDQHVRRWAATPYPSLFRHDRNRSFYRAAMQSLGASGQLVFSVVRLSGRPVAQHFGLRSRNDLLWYKPTFEIELAHCAPGEFLLKSLIEYSLEGGFEALDFTRGNEPFKSRFSSEVRFNASFTWVRGAWSRMLARIERGARTHARRLRAGLRAGHQSR
jgi:CelD/BcsL family acetyltransferase involved in cellulose biosynthesis